MYTFKHCAESCFLEFFVKVLQVTEPLEDRMEKALFSPPLSKQRVEFAVRHINELHATTLVNFPPNSLVLYLWKILFFIAKMHFQVDFGCGSGSLLDSLLEHVIIALEKLVSVDISSKAYNTCSKGIEHILDFHSSCPFHMHYNLICVASPRSTEPLSLSKLEPCI